MSPLPNGTLKGGDRRAAKTDRRKDDDAVNKSPAFQFYPKDFISDLNVQMMTMEERGVYITLLCSAWIEGQVPDDIIILKRLCKYKNIESSRVLEV